jgi:hypothetical protein
VSTRRIPTLLLVLLALLLTLAIATVALAAPDDHHTRRRTAHLTGAAEVPGPGDPDGWGHATIRINQQRHAVCYKLVVRRIAPATAAHIHVGGPDVAGPVVVGLGAPTDGRSSGCVANVDPELVRNLLRNPRDYYVNVHNAEYPAGAVRGQLMHPGNP